uniref:Uncharacterized protein n=1 Tax=Pyxicephalus adspersus TaxID=30357 RepID=A0AAV2ZS78_PYXAD|nr:TPA: hypothetical protein GDO54_005637 [Pyxicephalus adspersus]
MYNCCQMFHVTSFPTSPKCISIYIMDNFHTFMFGFLCTFQLPLMPTPLLWVACKSEAGDVRGVNVYLESVADCMMPRSTQWQ